MQDRVKINHLLILSGALLITTSFAALITHLQSQHEECLVYANAYGENEWHCTPPLQEFLQSVTQVLSWTALPIAAGAIVIAYALIAGNSIEVTGLFNTKPKFIVVALLITLAVAQLLMVGLQGGLNQYYIETRGCTPEYLATIPSESLKEQEEFCAVVIAVYNINAREFYVESILVLVWIVPLGLALFKGSRIPGFVQVNSEGRRR